MAKVLATVVVLHLVLEVVVGRDLGDRDGLFSHLSFSHQLAFAIDWLYESIHVLGLELMNTNVIKAKQSRSMYVGQVKVIHLHRRGRGWGGWPRPGPG